MRLIPQINALIEAALASWTGPPPANHDTTHENGGGDEINVGGLSGVLADPQTPATHSHPQSEVTSLVTDLANKAPLNHSHAFPIMIGDSGSDGEPGPPGLRGVDGAQGAPGASGVAGPRGMDGSDGESGSDGPPGPRGADGAPGSTGAQGQPGPAVFMLYDDGQEGERGPPGPIGPQGPAGGGGGSATTVEKDLGSALNWWGRFTITDGGISPSSKVLCWKAPGPYTGKGTRTDAGEMEPINIKSVIPGSGSAVVYWETDQLFASNNRPSAGGQPASAIIPGLKDPQAVSQMFPKRLNKVRGNVKFSYLVFA